jgi:thioredoxin-like negative regulator of GroEL
MNKKLKLIAIIGGVLILIVFGGLIVTYGQHYNDYPDTKNLSESMQTANQGTVVLVFHKTGCPDCRQIQKTVAETIRHNPQQSYIVMDYANAKAHPYFQQYNVTQTPTVMILKDGVVTAAYSGLNEATVVKMLRGEGK